MIWWFPILIGFHNPTNLKNLKLNTSRRQKIHLTSEIKSCSQRSLSTNSAMHNMKGGYNTTCQIPINQREIQNVIIARTESSIVPFNRSLNKTAKDTRTLIVYCLKKNSSRRSTQIWSPIHFLNHIIKGRKKKDLISTTRI